MRDELLVLEKAKNGNYTCRYNVGGKWKYLYSKYEPEKVFNDISIKDDADFIIVLGLGLGYELHQIRKMTSKPIIVFEFDQAFYYKILGHITPNITGILDDDITFYFGDAYKEAKLGLSKGQIITNNNLIQCNIKYYNEVISYINSVIRKGKVICMFEHPTILNDCADAFQELGYKIYILPWSNENYLLKTLASINPDYLFTINFSIIIAKISELLEIPYISWTVDTPAYSLYNLQNMYYKYSFFFVYDEKVVSHLKERGIKNIFYMPVAANVKRLEGIEVTNDDYRKYSAEVSFVGNSGVHNEFFTYIKPVISTDLNTYIDQLIDEQFSYEHFILKELIDESLVEKVESEINHIINFNSQALLPRVEKLAFLLGRYHSYLERIKFVNELSQHFEMKLYGDDSWLKSGDSNCLSKIYMGHAEHYYEMPKVFKLSKVNLNITRAFVETGLPMRVFDVLGSKGFLVTNNKNDISRLFKNGRDLVVYRDLKDLVEIVRYYLEHDDERDSIKEQGFETIRKNHSFPIRIKKMMEKISHIEN